MKRHTFYEQIGILSHTFYEKIGTLSLTQMISLSGALEESDKTFIVS